VRYLFITGNYKPAVNSGGPVNSVSSLAEGLVKRGHAVTVLALNEDDGVAMGVSLHGTTEINEVTVIYFKRGDSLCDTIRQRFTQVARWEPALFQWCSDHITSFDCVHLHIGLLQPGRWVARFCQKNGVALAYHQRGNLDPRRFDRFAWLKSWYIRVVESPVLNSADVLFALSARELEVYRMWTRNERTQLLTNGVDSNFWQSGQTEETLKLAEEVEAPAPQVVWSARWDLRKGAIEFIAIAQLVSKLRPDVRFLMMGPQRGAALGEIEIAVDKSGLKNLRVLKGLDKEGRRARLQAADFFVLPTYGEGFSLGILEALAAGCVLLTTEAANFPDLKEKIFGSILKNDPKVFADALMDQLSDTSIAHRQRGDAAREFTRKHFDWTIIVDRYVEIMEDVLNR
jgi:glycosyltransferase involved in cell wall biosynthesis